MIALIRKNLRLWGYGKSLALFTGCILFSISGRLNGGIAYERHILSAVSDHYYLTYFVLPIVLLLSSYAIRCIRLKIVSFCRLQKKSRRGIEKWISLQKYIEHTGCRPGQREVQAAEKLVVKHGGALGCEQRHILNDFLSVDSGQPLSGWFSLKSILPKRGSAFYINGMIFG